ncbi:MAG TPA: response regulator, partial [Rhodanobacteraceae bacterium]|nr:response regulator [Rhodanobacteraceae bacterium]
MSRAPPYGDALNAKKNFTPHSRHFTLDKLASPSTQLLVTTDRSFEAAAWRAKADLQCRGAARRFRRRQSMNTCTGSVLLVDDNDAFSSAVVEVARLAHCKITATDSLESARKLVAEKEYDLLLIDLALPDGNGLDLVQDIDLASQGRVAIVTGNPSIETAVRAVKSPAFEYLIKPVSM